MFKLMKQVRGGDVNLQAIKGRVLGTGQAKNSSGCVDGASEAVIGLCAYAFGELNGRILLSLERHFKIAPNNKPALRKLISDTFENPPRLKVSLSVIKKSRQRAGISSPHNDAHFLMNNLCAIAYESGNNGRGVLKSLIDIGKRAGLSQDEILVIFRKTRLAA